MFRNLKSCDYVNQGTSEPNSSKLPTVGISSDLIEHSHF